MRIENQVIVRFAVCDFIESVRAAESFSERVDIVEIHHLVKSWTVCISARSIGSVTVSGGCVIEKVDFPAVPDTVSVFEGVEVETEDVMSAPEEVAEDVRGTAGTAAGRDSARNFGTKRRKPTTAGLKT